MLAVLLTGNAEEMVKLDSRSSAQATLQAALAAARSRNSKVDRIMLYELKLHHFD